jgi:hypothetical protein
MAAPAQPADQLPLGTGTVGRPAQVVGGGAAGAGTWRLHVRNMGSANDPRRCSLASGSSLSCRQGLQQCVLVSATKASHQLAVPAAGHSTVLCRVISMITIHQAQPGSGKDCQHSVTSDVGYQAATWCT